MKPCDVDLAANTPGRHVGKEANRRRRVEGAGADRSWRVGAEGEHRIAEALQQLTARSTLARLLRRRPAARWWVLHSVPVGTGSADIDHVVCGPPGVFTINTKHHPGGRVDIGGEDLLVNRQPTRYIAKALAEADRARELLRVALVEAAHTELAGRLRVRSVLAFVGARVIGTPRAGTVLIATAGNLTHLLRSCPAELADVEIEALYQIARWSSMWTSPRPTAQPQHPQVLEWPSSSLMGVSELNNVPFVLKGWEDTSRWGFELGHFYAQLTHNGRSDDDGPEFWITPGGSQPVVTKAHELARRISSCTGVELDIVLQAMRSPLSESARVTIGLSDPR